MLATYGLNGKKKFPMTKNTVVRVHQNTNSDSNLEKKMEDFNNDLRLKILEDIYTKNEQLVKDKELKIQLLEQEILRLSEKDTFPFHQINSELKFHFNNVEKFAFAKMTQLNVKNDTISYDTIPTFLVNYREELKSKSVLEDNNKIKDWLQIRFNNPKISVINY